MKRNKCLNCEERHLGCHSTCDSYKKYKDHIQMIKDNKAKHKEKYAKTKTAMKYNKYINK